MEVSKAFFGWVAETIIPRGDGTAVQITTCKRSDGRVWHTWCVGMPMARGGFTHNPFDSSNRKMLADGINKATRPAIEKAHLKLVEVLKKEMKNV